MNKCYIKNMAGTIIPIKYGYNGYNGYNTIEEFKRTVMKNFKEECKHNVFKLFRNENELDSPPKNNEILSIFFYNPHIYIEIIYNNDAFIDWHMLSFQKYDVLKVEEDKKEKLFSFYVKESHNFFLPETSVSILNHQFGDEVEKINILIDKPAYEDIETMFKDLVENIDIDFLLKNYLYHSIINEIKYF